MKDLVTPVVNRAIKEKYGVKPTGILDSSGNPPSEENNFLYNFPMDLFEGVVVVGGEKYQFRIKKEEKAWKLFLYPI